MRSSLFVGFIVSLFIISLAARISTRKIFLASTFVGVVGAIVLVLSQSIYQATVGLFLIGFTGNGLTQLSYAVTSQITDKKLGTRFMSTFYTGLALGGVAISQAFEEIRDWRPVSIYMLLIPNVVLLVAIFFLL